MWCIHMLVNVRNNVIKRPIPPGIAATGIKKLISDTITNRGTGGRCFEDQGRIMSSQMNHSMSPRRR